MADDSFEKIVEKILKEITAELDMDISKARTGYLLSKDKRVIGISYFVNKEGKLKILMSPRGSGRPIDLGNYTMKELEWENSNARKTLITKIREEMSKQ